MPFQRRHAFAGRHVPHRVLSSTQTRRAARPETRQRRGPTTKTDHHKSTVDAATHARVPFQRRSQLDLEHHDPDTTRRPSGNTATPRTYDEDTSSQKYSGRRNAASPCAFRSPRRLATSQKRRPRPTPPNTQATSIPSLRPASRHLPVASVTPWTNPRSAPDTTRRPSGNTATPQTYDGHRSSQKHSGRRNALRVPSSDATHVPVATSHTLSVNLRHDAPPVRKHGNQLTYDEHTSSQKYSGAATHVVRVPFQRPQLGKLRWSTFGKRHEPQVAARRRRDRARVPDRLQDLHRFGFRRGRGGVRVDDVAPFFSGGHGRRLRSGELLGNVLDLASLSAGARYPW